MNFYRTLPAAVRFGAPLLLLAIIGALLYFTVLKKNPDPIAFQTPHVEELDASKKLLDSAGVKYIQRRHENGDFVLEVTEETEHRAASTLKGSGMSTRLELAKPIECPNEPGFTGSRTANERFDSCSDAAEVQKMLLTAGVLAANVRVKSVESSRLIGPATTKMIAAQVFPSKKMRAEFEPANYAVLARTIANAAGTQPENVTIVDAMSSEALYDGGAINMEGNAATSGGATFSASGCGKMSEFSDIAEKQVKVRECYERTVSDKLARMLGGADRFVLTADVDINGATESETRTTTSEGAVVRETGDHHTRDTSRAPDSTVHQETRTPGAIKRLSLTVVLDSRFVNPREELAVKDTLRSFTIPERGDPVPVTRRILFDRTVQNQARGSSAATNRAAAAASSAQAAETRQKAADTETKTAQDAARSASRMNKVLMAIGAVIIIGLLTALAVLWRRSQRLSADRERLAAEFRNEQRLLEDFAQQNPDDIARDLEQLFRMPAAEPARPLQ